jgi:preprotein translocase SecE subunit
LATKSKKPASEQAATDTKVTRIKATDTKSAAVKTKTAETKKTAETDFNQSPRNPLAAIGGYFAGAWYELKQVRWPNRRATWSMTMAVLAFTAFFVLLILLLDALFKYLFQLILG